MPGVFSDKVINFTDEPVVQCDVTVVKMLGDIQIVTKKLTRILNVLLLEPILCIVLVS